MTNDKFAILKEKQAEIEKLKKEMLEASNKIFTDLTKTIFEDHPKVESFGWTQYTPYFNDGDTCTFSAHTDYIYLNGESVDEAKWLSPVNVKTWGTWNREKRVYEGREEVPNLDYDKELADAVEEIKEFLHHFDNEFFLSQFGDHAEVTITREGVDINECEHD